VTDARREGDGAAGRIQCSASGCRRGIGVDAWRRRFGDLHVETAEYVCQRHWSQVPAAMRLVYARARRRDRRLAAHLPSTDRIWRRIMADVRPGT
jgi:anti-sigma-K factor RskA